MKKIKFDNLAHKKAVDEYVNEVSTYKILRLLVLYRLKGRNDFADFETYCELILKECFGSSYELEVSAIEKEIKKRGKNKV